MGGGAALPAGTSLATLEFLIVATFVRSWRAFGARRKEIHSHSIGILGSTVALLRG